MGHLNLGNLISLMPEAVRADSGLVLYRKDLLATGDTLAMAFEKEYKAFVEAYNAGTLSASQSQKRQESLQKQQQVLRAYAQEVEEKVTNLRRQLLEPILTRIDQAIKTLGKEGKYDVIFDSGTGSTLFAQDSEDLMPLLKQKLGLK
ncbi:MAG: OmpH family outer membrane protein [Saprospiraceae bacterium]|nr:OmpH family outer membrane protein [Saprospiraceae bacterium]